MKERRKSTSCRRYLADFLGFSVLNVAKNGLKGKKAYTVLIKFIVVPQVKYDTNPFFAHEINLLMYIATT